MIIEEHTSSEWQSSTPTSTFTQNSDPSYTSTTSRPSYWQIKIQGTPFSHQKSKRNASLHSLPASADYIPNPHFCVPRALAMLQSQKPSLSLRRLAASSSQPDQQAQAHGHPTTPNSTSGVLSRQSSHFCSTVQKFTSESLISAMPIQQN